ncbi:putative mfs transporter protein [Phaeoacremonium minimum UCRPA7]|uniref:Putative mfs transporter protein n=1 Tax=Phaeoacremonium minimum (strain UCR-PA7) TaxID=1286976 RepID=R8BE16_PHAM7|nr:putative mfs transporter protein [Phaeoacremonium minimum UCRPA7]EON97548.1 putative mfs transporter protein [Phaeoacremonium minimum UCRPA7]
MAGDHGVGVEMVENGKPEATVIPEFSQDEINMEKRIVRKIDKRLLPTTAIVYLLCYIDRSNIGTSPISFISENCNAKILNSATGDDILQTNNITSYQFTVALMLFLVAYSVFEAPSNLALKVFSPRRWLAFLVVAFGTFCAGIGGTTNAAGVTALRFFLGAAEAGVFPGMIYYFSFWYRPEERASRIAAFLCSATLSGAFGGCIAYGVGHMNGAGGLEAWRWLFILEGLPSIVAGVLIFFFLPSYPEHVGWLTEEEKQLQVRRMGIHSLASEEKISWKDAKVTLTTARFYFHYLAYFGIGSGVASLSLFSPTIVAGLGYKNLDAQLYTVPPYAIAYVVTLVAAWMADKYKTRGLVAGTSFVVASLAFIISAALPGEAFKARYALLCIATSGVFGGLPPLCAWVGDNSRTTTAGALATALNVALSGPGQIIGVWIYRAKDAPVYRLGHGVNAALVGMSAIVTFGLSFHYRRLNAKMAGTNELRWMP